MAWKVLLSALVLTSLPSSVDAAMSGVYTLGALKLDNMTFDKVINVPEFTFFVRIGETYNDPASDDAKAFKTLCDMAAGAKKFLVAEIPVQPPIPGHMENFDIFERFSLQRDEFPAFFLYTEEVKQPINGPSNGIRYHGPIEAELMAAWLRRHNVPVPIVGTIVEFDNLAKKFMKDLSDSHIVEAKKIAETTFASNAKAQMYVRTMEKVKAKGKAYIAEETKRVQKMAKIDNQSEENKAKLAEKLKVLAMFPVSVGKDGKEEL